MSWTMGARPFWASFDLRGFGTQNADFGFVRFLVSLYRSPMTPVIGHMADMAVSAALSCQDMCPCSSTVVSGHTRTL